jgi:hypothetical protein
MVRPSESTQLGAFVTLPGALGVGKIIEIRPPLVVVRLFHSLSEHEDREFQLSARSRFSTRTLPS